MYAGIIQSGISVIIPRPFWSALKKDNRIFCSHALSFFPSYPEGCSCVSLHEVCAHLRTDLTCDHVFQKISNSQIWSAQLSYDLLHVPWVCFVLFCSLCLIGLIPFHPYLICRNVLGLNNTWFKICAMEALSMFSYIYIWGCYRRLPK